MVLTLGAWWSSVSSLLGDLGAELTSPPDSEPVMFKVADGWSWYHQYISKVPNWVLLAFSGFLMNIVVSVSPTRLLVMLAVD